VRDDYLPNLTRFNLSDSSRQVYEMVVIFEFVYTDGVHLMSPNTDYLHEFAESIGLKRCWFHGARKGHPHYDLVKKGMKEKARANGAILVTTREMLRLCKK
jgi:hypothetical protein